MGFGKNPGIVPWEFEGPREGEEWGSEKGATTSHYPKKEGEWRLGEEERDRHKTARVEKCVM